jgi:cytosine/adenosine deaminase-related metal-dependent hydrolase
MPPSTIIENATILSMAKGSSPFIGDVRIESDRITHMGTGLPEATHTVDASDQILLPGFIQTHIHLCQTLFRNMAEDLSLLDWLKLRIWPMEAALKESDMAASADLGLAELILGGTTTLLDMGSVHHTDQIALSVKSSGVRAFLGKAMMDKGDDVPGGLKEGTQDSLKESASLFQRWHGACNGRIQYAYAPRFALSCSQDLLHDVGSICAENDIVIHTHCAESSDETAWVRSEHGVSNLSFLETCGLTGPKSVFAHMIHLEPEDSDVVLRSGTHIAHCPCSNCKLASGIAPIPDYLKAGINVSLGADGAPCNNTLDMFWEMRLAALLQKPRFGPAAMPAETVLKMATINGAKALGIEKDVGSIEPGKKADLILVHLNRPFNGVAGDPMTRLVFTGSRENVTHVWCDGALLVTDGKLVNTEEGEILARAKEASSRVCAKI